MSYYEIITIVISLISVLVAGSAALFTYRNLKEIRNQFFEQNRGNLVFYIDKLNSGILHSLVIKNYGNSPAKLLSISISPELDWDKTKANLPNKFNISNCHNVFIAPKHHIMTEFDFRDYPDQVFQIGLIYETCGKTLTESYTIDLRFSHHLISSSTTIKDELKALKEINNSIQKLSDRFL